MEDGMLIAAAEEERFSRKKHDYDFPEKAIAFCLQQGNITGQDLDYVVFFEKPFLKFDRLFKTTIHGFPRTYWMFAQSMRTWLSDKLWVKSHIASNVGVRSNQVLFSEHHLSHSASAFLCSPFQEAAVITFDGVGEWATTTIGTGSHSTVSIDRELHFPHSIGLLYSAFTAFLGFEVNDGEFKVMGMAPYGSPLYTEKVWEMVQQSDDGAYWLDPRFFSLHHSTKRTYTREFTNLFGRPRDPKVPFYTQSSGYPLYYGQRPTNFDEVCEYNQRYADIAASIQMVTEQLIIGIAKAAHRDTGMKNLCLAGGVALNSVANERILRETPFENLYVQPDAGDGGGSLGAALYAWHTALGNPRRFVMDHAYWGQAYSNREIKQAIDGLGFDARLVQDEDKLIENTVDLLTKDKVIGWFQGRFEWGPRALGNRSILADPRSAEMKDVVNNKIKFREPFRPFAPSVLVGDSEKYFALKDSEASLPARFMLRVVPVNPEHQGDIPAVNHMGTARVQTVHPSSNPLYYRLIEAFRDATGVPVLLNTSFNVRGEPIVNSPEDALRTFVNSGIDALVMGNYIVDRPKDE
tara:strand:+ start:3920 stop:5653 length:1734 start_codon:yes stop_codon:yes gene_type:complete